MNVAASPIWLAYAFGIGVALALLDRGLKVRWLAMLFLTGAAAITAYGVYQILAQSFSQGLWTSSTVFAVLAAGYLLVETLFWIARGVSR